MQLAEFRVSRNTNYPYLHLFKSQTMKTHLIIFHFLFPALLMAQQEEKVRMDVLQSFVDAFNAHDLKAIMSHMTEDAVFEASAGPDVNGEKFVGQEQVRKAFEDVFKNFPDAQWSGAQHVISGNRGFSEWTFRGTKADGNLVEVTGCDLFTFRGDKIAVKNSYRKNRIPVK